MFQGTYTAIVTPFYADGRIDFEQYQSLIERQIEAGVEGIVPAGSTGESPSLSYEEHLDVIKVAVNVCRGRTKVIAGTGSNTTKEAVELTRQAMDVGIDATLQVTPYYNKPNAVGLQRHFETVADLGCPVVLYNVPGRSACEISLETVVALAAHPSIVAIKEAGGSVDRVSAIRDACNLTVLSGDDSLALPMILVGGSGVISVASNLAPREVATMISCALNGDWDSARAAHARLYPLFRDMFIDTNPIPVKAALTMMGMIEAHYRLPLCPLDDEKERALRATLIKTGLLKGVQS